MTTNLLSWYEYAINNTLDENKTYVDKFWLSISEYKWIDIDHDILNWIGHDENNKNNIINISYKLLQDNIHCDENHEFTFNQIDNKLSIDPNYFTGLLLLIGSDESRTLSKKYQAIEKLYRSYFKYCQDLIINTEEQIPTRISNSVLNYIIALDKGNKIAYFGKSATEMGRNLKQLNSNKKINRKTITKRIADGVLYGGYKWIKHDSNVYQNYTMIDVTIL